MADERTPDRLVVIGANHRTSSEATRDRLFLSEDEAPGFLRAMRAAGMDEAVVLSTCARTEILATADDAEAAREGAVAALAELGGLAPDALDPETYCHVGEGALRHMFRVAASLDSPVVGEPEVTGQFRDAVRLAEAAGTVGPGLGAMLQAANGVAKRVRAETAIGERPVSMAACAVQVAREVHGDLSRVSALLVAGGEMGELIVDQLRAAGLSRLTVAARRPARAEISARRYSCHHAGLDDLPAMLPRMDIVVSSLGAGQFLFGTDVTREALAARRRHPMLFVDAAIPSDVDPAVNDLDGAFVYSLDDLERIAMEGRSRRDEAAGEAEAIVDAEVARYLHDVAQRAAVPTVAALRGHFEKMRVETLRDLGLDDAGAADEATRRLINRLLHDPSEALRALAAGDDAGSADADRLVRRLFSIDPPDGRENDT